MIRIKVDVDSDLLQMLAYRLPAMFGQKVAPNTSTAFNTAAQMIRRYWTGWAMGGPIEGIPNIKNPNGKLASSIKINRNGPFDANIETESHYAKRIQDGTPELDMKTTHPYGAKSRVSQEGIPYLIVPFRWGTPNKAGGARAHFGNVIPQSFYSAIQAFKMDYSHRLKKTHTEKNYSGMHVERSDYLWAPTGGRIEADGNINGLVRMHSETRRGGSTYFTFRIISAAQLVTKPYSWIRRAVDPIDVVGALQKTTQPIVEDLIQAGLEADIGV